MTSSLRTMVATIVESLLAGRGIEDPSVRVDPPRDPLAADLQTNAALVYAKTLGLRPLDLAASLTEGLVERPCIAVAQVSGHGFIEIQMTAESLCGLLDERDVPEKSLGRVIIDFGGPNVAKPLHVGHLRSLVIGESLRRILTAVGYHVVSDVHLGDWGLQMGQIVDALHLDDVPVDDVPGLDLSKVYADAAKACREDEARMERARQTTAALQRGEPKAVAMWRALRDRSLALQIPIFDRLGAHFDLMEGESDVADRVETMVDHLREEGIATESEGAIVIAVDRPEDGERPMPPLLLRKRDGAALYGTTDLATIFTRVERFSPERIVYVVDQRQADHFAQVFRAWERVAGALPALEHAGFGTVNGPDRKPLRTRDGGAPELARLIDEVVAAADARLDPEIVEDRDAIAEAVGIGALKFADLKSSRLSGYVHDPEAAVAFEGDTGPYLQYACVRIASLMARASNPGPWQIDPQRLEGAARAIILVCLEHADAVAQAARTLEPSIIAAHALRLARAFNAFYGEARIIGSEDESHRMAICALCKSVLERDLFLLGINVPVRM